MIPVTVADVVMREQKIEGQERPLLMYVVILLDTAGRRIVPIWVGPYEGQSIAMGVRGHAMPRPLTHEFAASIFAASGAQLEEVRIESLREETFYAIVKIRAGESVHEIDARPSDALAFAVRAGCPIYVSPDVMAQAGDAVPDGAGVPNGKGIIQVIAGFEEGVKASWPRQRSAEEREKSRCDLMSVVFGTQP